MRDTLRVGLMLPESGASWFGGVDYFKNLGLALLDTRELAVELFLVIPEENPELLNLYRPLLQRAARVLRVPNKRRLTLIERLKVRLGFTTEARIRQATLLSGLASAKIDFAYPLDGALPENGAIASAAWIPDFQHVFLPQFFSERENLGRSHLFSQLAETSNAVILSSNDARQHFVRSFPHQAHKARIMHFSHSPSDDWFSACPDATREKYHLPKRYFIVSNQLWQHKNHLLILDALGQLATEDCRPTVVLTGSLTDYRKPDFVNQVVQAIAQKGLGQQVHVLGVLPKSEQIALVRGSLAIVQPSLFEGWSSIVEIGRALGKPMLLSDIAVHKEQAPPKATYFRPTNHHSLAQAMVSTWDSLTPGPSLPDEQAALLDNTIRVREFAHTFAAIARDLCSTLRRQI